MPEPSVNFDMAINLARLRSGLGQAVGLVRGGVGQIGRVFNSLTNPFAALGIGAGAAGIGALISKAASLGDELDEAASRIGINVERLQELQHGARLTGAGVEGLEKGLTRLNKALGEAGSGNAEAIKLFKDLGVNVRDEVTGNLRDAGDVIDQLADRIQATESPAERTRLVMAAFGREGAKLVPLLEGGAAGLRVFAQEARRLGFVMDAETAKAAGKLRDQMDTLSAAVSTTLTRAIVSVGPGLEALVSKLAEGAAAIGKMAESALPDKLAPLDELDKRLVALGARIEHFKRQVAGQGIGAKLNLFFGQGDSLRAQLADLERQRAELEKLRGDRQHIDTAREKAAAGPSTEQKERLGRLQNDFLAQIASNDLTRQIEQFRAKVEETASLMSGPAAASVRALGDAYVAFKTSLDEAAKAQDRLSKGEDAASFFGLGESNIFKGLEDIKKFEGAAKGLRESITELVNKGIPLSQVFDVISGAQSGVGKTLEALKAKYAGTPAIFEKLLDLERRFGNGGLQREADAIAKSLKGVREGSATVQSEMGAIIEKAPGIRSGISTIIDTTEGISTTVIPRFNNAGIAVQGLGTAVQGVANVIDAGLIPASADVVTAFDAVDIRVVTLTDRWREFRFELGRVLDQMRAIVREGGQSGPPPPGNF